MPLHLPNYIHLSSRYTSINQRRQLANELIHTALHSVDAYAATTRALRQLEGQVNLNQCTVIAFGKAALSMARAAHDQLDIKQGVVHCFESGQLGPLRLVRSAHPLPAHDAVERGDEVLSLARSLNADDIALCLISGGGSAMLERPRSGLSLSDLSAESAKLMRAGVDIMTLNRRRAELSMIKGGGLAQALRPAKIINIIISDTPGAPLETVASGPTLPSDHTLLAADHLTMREAVLRAAPHLRPLDEIVQGEARHVGQRLANLPAGFVATGETTVTVSGQGRGGRNHELILGAIQAWRHTQRSNGLLLSIGSDGIDGSSDAAGAWCDEVLLQNSPDPSSALANNDSHQYFKRVGGQITTGPTGTNVADLIISLP